MLKTWLRGGQVTVNKNCYYAHYFKRKNRGWSNSHADNDRAERYGTWFWMTDQLKDRVMTLQSLVERFNLPDWPSDLDWAFRHAREVLSAAKAA